MEIPYNTLTNWIRRFDNCIQQTSRKFNDAIQDDRGKIMQILKHEEGYVKYFISWICKWNTHMCWGILGMGSESPHEVLASAV